MTTTQRRYALLLALAIVAFMLCACLYLDDGERVQWQREVLSRQRGLERPTVTPTVEEAR